MDDTYWNLGDPLDGPEKWTPVVGYESIYEVSTHGRVRRIAGGKGTKGPVPYFLKPILGAGRSRVYQQVRLHNNNIGKTHRVHCVVARAFRGPPPEEEIGGFYRTMQVGHIDGNPQNNRADNLEYQSQRQNREEQWNNYISRGQWNG